MYNLAISVFDFGVIVYGNFGKCAETSERLGKLKPYL